MYHYSPTHSHENETEVVKRLNSLLTFSGAQAANNKNYAPFTPVA